MQQEIKPSFESEGFRAHQYLKTRRRRRRWQYQVSSQLTTALVEKPIQWKRAEIVRSIDRERTPAKVPKQLAFEFELAAIFQSLVHWWREDTKHMSNMNKAIVHPAYQQIIGIGKVLASDMVPLLLKELDLRPDHWFHALIEITGTDAAAAQETFDGAVVSWLEWGRRKGYLVDARSAA
jgi:hypothetical protein